MIYLILAVLFGLLSAILYLKYGRIRWFNYVLGIASWGCFIMAIKTIGWIVLWLFLAIPAILGFVIGLTGALNRSIDDITVKTVADTGLFENKSE